MVTPDKQRYAMMDGLRDVQYRHMLALHAERAQRGEFWLNYPIDGDLIELAVMPILKAVEQGAELIRIFINSPGGSVSDGQALIDTIKALPVPVWTINVGAAHSMALSVYLAGDRRFTMPGASFMAHDASYSAGEEKLAEHEAYSRFAKSQRKLDAEYYASRTDHSPAWWLKKFTSTDYWFSAPEAIRIGVAHELVTAENFSTVFKGEI